MNHFCSNARACWSPSWVRLSFVFLCLSSGCAHLEEAPRPHVVLPQAAEAAACDDTEKGDQCRIMLALHQCEEGKIDMHEVERVYKDTEARKQKRLRQTWEHQSKEISEALQQKDIWAEDMPDRWAERLAGIQALWRSERVLTAQEQFGISTLLTRLQMELRQTNIDRPFVEAKLRRTVNRLSDMCGISEREDLYLPHLNELSHDVRDVLVSGQFVSWNKTLNALREVLDNCQPKEGAAAAKRRRALSALP